MSILSENLEKKLILGLPDSFFTYFSKKSPFFLIDDTIYFTSSNFFRIKKDANQNLKQLKDVDKRALLFVDENNFIISYLEKGPTIETAKDFYQKLNESDISKVYDAIRREFLNKFNLTSIENILLKFRNRNKDLYFVLFEVLPNFIKREEIVIDEILQGKPRGLCEEDIIAYIKKNIKISGDVDNTDIDELKNLERDIPSCTNDSKMAYSKNLFEIITYMFKQSNTSNLISKLVDKYYGKKDEIGTLDSKIGFFNNKAYSLSETSEPPNEQWEFSLIIRNKYYKGDSLIDNNIIEDAFKHYTIKELEEKVVKDCNESLKEIKERLIQSKYFLSLILGCNKLNKIEVGDFGIKFGSPMTIYLKVPKYALYFERGYYIFEPCTVAMNISATSYGAPYVVERYSHPFLKNPNESLQPICLGEYSPQPNLPIAQQIVDYIVTTKKVIMSGYTPNYSRKPYHRLHNFEQTPMSRTELEKNGIVVSNIG